MEREIVNYSELNEYIRQGEPDRVGKAYAWQTAIGLQDVDGLKTSPYLLETAKKHIEGEISIAEANTRIQNYYDASNNRSQEEKSAQEADIVSSRITQILGEQTFNLSPVELQAIHKKLFRGVFEHAGLIRDYNFSKKEWVLNGESVLYSAFDSITDTLEYDFAQEKKFSYAGLTPVEIVRHIERFISGIWQIHPFCEGNTRTIAVFVIKYLQKFGFETTNGTFAANSWYFRNALVRANFDDVKTGVRGTTQFLDLFFDNLVLEKNHDLKNRHLHIDWKG